MLRNGKENIRNVPPDARKSLEVLDSVLGEFDSSEDTRRCESERNLRVSSDVNEEVNKSIEVLDRVLDEFQNENRDTNTFRRRQKLDRKATPPQSRHEDIRRSLEVLDSVLAEFDDCLESWDNITAETHSHEDESLRIYKNKDPNDDGSLNSFSCDSQATDGSTSHDSGICFQEQVKVTSPPPVPKRSAATKLSDRNSGLFTFPLAAATTTCFDSLPSDLAKLDNGPSLSKSSDAINTLSAKEDDEVFKRQGDDDHTNKYNNARGHRCVKCGKAINKSREHAMEKKVSKDSISPFSERRKMFEDRIVESRISISPLLERSFTGSSFKVRPSNRTKESESEPSSLVFYRSNDCDHQSGESSSQSSFASKYSPKATKVTPPRVDGFLSLPTDPHHAPNCNCKERIRQLQVKFAETRRLLKANKIRGLDSRPPSFVPPPPPPEIVAKHATKMANRQHLANGYSESAATSDTNSYSASNGSLNSESVTSEMSDHSFDPSQLPDSEKKSSDLCEKCSSSSEISEVSLISETIEDIPKLLPTDALKRPHLGLSYCMEDDFCPGVKEILQTSTPIRNGVSLSKNKKTNSLSTFNLSDNISLGYASSQSDLDLNNSPYRTDRVPVSSVKFSTLPEGMDLHSLPWYYSQDESSSKGHKSNGQPLYRDRNFNHTMDPQQHRSSSAPPLPEPEEKPKKKHFRGFSRKDKKSEKKHHHEDSISVKSYVSLDDGVVFKAIDGDTSSQNPSNSREIGVEKKRWGALRSLLGKR